MCQYEKLMSLSFFSVKATPKTEKTQFASINNCLLLSFFPPNEVYSIHKYKSLNSISMRISWKKNLQNIAVRTWGLAWGCYRCAREMKKIQLSKNKVHSLTCQSKILRAQLSWWYWFENCVSAIEMRVKNPEHSEHWTKVWKASKIDREDARSTFQGERYQNNRSVN